MIPNDEIKKILDFSMLKLEGDEFELLKKKLNESLNHIKILEEADTEGVEPLYRVFDYSERFREDVVDKEMTLTREEVLENTVEQQYGYFKLLNIMD